MAIHHLIAKILSRARGPSVVASAAYCSGRWEFIARPAEGDYGTLRHIA